MQTSTAGLMPLKAYVHALRKDLPAEVFQPAPARLLWIPVHVAVIAAGIWAMAAGALPGWVWPLVSLVIGASFAGLTFVGHEALHGGIVRGRTARHVVGWIGFLPFMVSPRLWTAWHGRVHHSNANHLDDPDRYPTLELYRADGVIRFITNWFALGGRRLRGGLSLFLGFSVQSFNQLVQGESRGFLKRRAHRLAIAESIAGLAVWTTLAVVLGGVPFLFAFVLPLLVANAIVMGFILTNHSLSPLANVNDPLYTGLTVTVPRWVDWVTLGFGAHVEHHLFPGMSSRHAPTITAQLRARWPERYQSMPLGAALLALHRTARVYKDATTQIDPYTDREHPTLGTVAAA